MTIGALVVSADEMLHEEADGKEDSNGAECACQNNSVGQGNGLMCNISVATVSGRTYWAVVPSKLCIFLHHGDLTCKLGAV